MININENKVDAREIYNYIGVKSRFNDWFKNSIDFIGAKNGIDFYKKNSKSTGGRPTIEYYVTIDCAKELCLVQRTAKSKELRQWLISISKKIENANLVTKEQVFEVMKMVKVFSVYEYRRLALQKNAENFVNNAISIHPEYSRNKNLI